MLSNRRGLEQAGWLFFGSGTIFGDINTDRMLIVPTIDIYYRAIFPILQRVSDSLVVFYFFLVRGQTSYASSPYVIDCHDPSL